MVHIQRDVYSEEVPKMMMFCHQSSCLGIMVFLGLRRFSVVRVCLFFGFLFFDYIKENS